MLNGEEMCAIRESKEGDNVISGRTCREFVGPHLHSFEMYSNPALLLLTSTRHLITHA